MQHPPDIVSEMFPKTGGTRRQVLGSVLGEAFKGSAHEPTDSLWD